MPWNMVSGKPSNQSARGVDIPPTTCIWFFWLLDSTVGIRVARATRSTCFVVALQTYVLHFGSAYGPAIACGGSDPWVGMKGKRLLWNAPLVFQACELGLPCKVKFDSESSVSHDDWDCLIPLSHRVTRATIWLVILMVEIKNFTLLA
jgi:hypothetical protein